MLRVRANPEIRHGGTPFVELDRQAWSALRANTPMTLSEADVQRVRGLGDRIDLHEVEEVYLPMARLLNLYIAGVPPAAHRHLDLPRRDAGAHPVRHRRRGSGAVGKSTTARILRELLARWPDTPRVELVTTDGSCSRTPSWSAAGCSAARASRSPTTGGRCSASSPRSSPAAEVRRRSTRTCPTTSCPASRR
jgi:hypothetical protein